MRRGGSMADAKDRVAASIARARADLDQALADLDHLPSVEAGAVAFAGHALGNYLTVTGGTADLLVAALAQYPDPQIRVWLDGISHVTNLMTHLTTELMRHTSETYRPQLTFEPVDVPVVIARVVQFYRRKAGDKRIRITADLHLDEPFAWADRVAVAVVIDNLLSNAIKYSPHGTEVRTFVAEESDSLVCSVQDEGPGISNDDQAKLFQRGVRLSSVPTADEPSTGYGLALAKELMDALGGNIWCESRLGHGARFSFRLLKYRRQQAGQP